MFTTTLGSALMKDKIEPVLGRSFHEEDNLFAMMMDDSPKERTSQRGRRKVIRVQPNASYGSPTEGAAMPIPGQPLDVEILIKYLNQFKLGEVSGEIRDMKTEDAIINFLAVNQKDDTITFNHEQNIMLYGNGNNARGVVTATNGTTTITCDPATTDKGSENILIGARMQVFTSAGVQRTGGSVTVSTVSANNKTTGVITFDAVPSDTAATDIIVYENSYGRGTHGLPFHIDDANTAWLLTSGTRGTYTGTKGIVHDAGVAALSQGMIDIAQHKSKKAKGSNVPINDFVLVSHPAQKLMYRSLGYALTRVVPVDGSTRKFDLGFPDATPNGLRWKEDWDAAPTDVWGLRLKTWKIEFVKLPGFYEFNGGDRLIQSPGSATYKDAYQYAVYARYDVLCSDPASNFRIKRLTYTAGLA
jgi:hypothetical protein